jgi:MFS family permease
MLLGLVAGVLVDRARRRPLLVVTDLGRGILLLAVPMLAMTHQLNVAWLMALMATFGLMSLVNDAAFQAFVPRLVPAKLLTQAHARLDQSDAVAQTSGPVRSWPADWSRWWGRPPRCSLTRSATWSRAFSC